MILYRTVHFNAFYLCHYNCKDLGNWYLHKDIPGNITSHSNAFFYHYLDKAHRILFASIWITNFLILAGTYINIHVPDFGLGNDWAISFTYIKNKKDQKDWVFMDSTVYKHIQIKKRKRRTPEQIMMIGKVLRKYN
jgi:hypothetical protein